MSKGFKKRIISIAVMSALLLGSGIFTSCSGADGDGDDTELSLSTLELLPPENGGDGNEVDLDLPSEFLILREAGAEPGFFPGTESQSLIDKKIFERNAALNERCGVNLSEITEPDILTYVKTAALSEEKSFDMMIISGATASSLISSRLLSELSKIHGFDPKLDGYNSKVIGDLALGDMIFLAAGDALPSLFRSATVLLANTELLRRVDGEYIFDRAVNGRFTYDDMFKLSGALASLSGDNSLPSDAINASSSDSLSLFLSAGGEFFKLDRVTDTPYAADFSSENDKNSEAYRLLMKLFGYDTYRENGDTVPSVTPLFTVGSMGELELLKASGAPYAALPLPKGEADGTGYISNTEMSTVSFTALPLNCDLEISVAVMNKIYEFSDGIVEEIKISCSADETEKDVLGIVEKSIICYPLSLFGFGDIGGLMRSAVDESLSEKAFRIRAGERSAAAAAALEILINKTSE